MPQFSSAVDFLPKGEARWGKRSQLPCAHHHPFPHTHLGPSEQLDEAATIWGCDTESLRAKQGPRQDQPLPVAEESQEQEAGAEEHKAANEQHHQHCGAWGGRAVSAPPRPPSHLFAPMSARSPPGATRGGKSMCSHKGMKPPLAPGAPQDNAAPQGQPPMAPTCLLRVQGDARDGGAAGWAAGGFKDLLGDSGHCGTERGL